MQQNLSEILSSAMVVPVLVIDSVSDALPLAEALVEGGMDVLEVTLRTDAAIASLEAIAKHFPEVRAAAGTALTGEDMRRSVDAGASFVVSPGATEQLLDEAENCDIPLLPGATNPSEVMRLLERGYQYQKFFPAQAAGGVPMLKSIAGPLPNVRFCPTGGIGPSNAADFLALPNVVCVGGSWMAAAKLIQERSWTEITRLAQEAKSLSTLLSPALA